VVAIFLLDVIAKKTYSPLFMYCFGLLGEFQVILLNFEVYFKTMKRKPILLKIGSENGTRFVDSYQRKRKGR
jgi:hypothetical protein